MINVGKTSSINNQKPDGASNPNGDNQFFTAGCNFSILFKLLEDSIYKLVII